MSFKSLKLFFFFKLNTDVIYKAAVNVGARQDVNLQAHTTFVHIQHPHF